ncbi:hypothetical protein HGA91_04015 [candidate division WWE3 bacterium]|nr:hypothetical protein [candidate division WWE3 bacterium]
MSTSITRGEMADANLSSDEGPGSVWGFVGYFTMGVALVRLVVSFVFVVFLREPLPGWIPVDSLDLIGMALFSVGCFAASWHARMVMRQKIDLARGAEELYQRSRAVTMASMRFSDVEWKHGDVIVYKHARNPLVFGYHGVVQRVLGHMVLWSVDYQGIAGVCPVEILDPNHFRLASRVERDQIIDSFVGAPVVEGLGPQVVLFYRDHIEPMIKDRQVVLGILSPSAAQSVDHQPA